MLILTTSQFGSMPGGDHCAVWGCDNDRRYPEKLKILPHVGMFRFYSPKNKQDVLSWSRAINRDKFKVTVSTKVCSNHFAQGYRNPQCRTPTLYMKGYDCEELNFKDRLLRSESRKYQIKRPEKENKVEMVS